jgi:hypothetical protein
MSVKAKEGVDFKTSKGIITELEGAVNDVKADKGVLEVVRTRITGCKHAIQVFALSMEYAKMKGHKGTKLKQISLE